MSEKSSSKVFASLLGKPWSGVAVLLVFYLVLIAIFSVLSPFFFGFRNMLAIGSNVAFIGLMAAAGTPLIIAGGLDLSVAAVAGLTGVVIATLASQGLTIWLAVLVALLLAAAIGLLNGLFATRLRLNPLIVTLGMMSIVGGAALILTGGLTRALFVPGFNWIGQGRLYQIPVPLILMLIAYAAIAVVLRFTRFGRFVYASGGNPGAPPPAPLPVGGVQIALYVVSAVSGSFAGTMLAEPPGAAAPAA